MEEIKLNEKLAHLSSDGIDNLMNKYYNGGKAQT